jgi:LacI family transcriptional regulator
MPESSKSRVTLLDVAAHADVSRATVSLVIRNVASVSDATRKKVMLSIKKLGYVYHRGAASLRSQQANAVGLIVSDITNPFFAEVIIAIEERLAASGLVTLLGNTSENRVKEDRLLKTMREFPADGILICPAFDLEPSESIADARHLLPLVAFVRRLPGIDYAGVNNVQGAEIAVDHLCNLGHRRIAFIGGNPEVSTGRERLKGYHQALTRRKRKYDPQIVIPSLPNRRGGFDAIHHLLQLDIQPTAAICFNDVVALGAIEAIQRLGLAPGADFAVIGFNNIPDAAQNIPGLTTIDTAPRQLGEVAAELLIKRIEKPDAPIQTVILQPRLIIRDSCGATQKQAETANREL